MTKSVSKIAAARLRYKRPCSDVGELLPDYIVNLLAAPAAEEVEDHLLACLSCREKFLAILRIRSAARARRAAAGGGETHAADNADVLRMSDFKK